MLEKDRKKLRRALIAIVILIISYCIMNGFFGKLKQEPAGEREPLQMLCEAIGRQAKQNFFFLTVYLGEKDNKTLKKDHLLIRMINEEIPLFGYLEMQPQEREEEDRLLAQIIRQKEGTDEDVKNIEESRLDYGEDALHIESSMLEEMQRENNKYLEQEEEEAEGESTEQDQESLEEESFAIPEYPAYSYDWSEGWGYEELVSNFYAIDNTTSLKQEYTNLDDLLYRDLSVNKNADGPQILIYHTHSQEGFVDSVPGDASTTIVGAGEKLAVLLTEKYGYKVLHHTGEYDVENRDYAYNNSLSALEEILAENPTIEVVIDLHRDEMKEGKKLVIDLQGRPTARFMFFNGMSHIRNKGDISYLENPYIQDNLAFSFQTQVAANEYYPGIARKIYLKAYRYNMHLKPKSLLVELGAQTNTVEEIMNACDPLAHIISIVLGG